jgi:pilus assembly protein CpaB
VSRRAVFGLVVALLLALLGVIVLVGAANRAQEADLTGKGTTVVVVATEPIAQGTPVALLQDSVERRAVPSRDVAAGAISDLDELDPGSVTAVPLVEGEQLLASRFVEQRALGRASVPPGLQEVTVVLAPERVVGGALRPGDRVGVLFSFKDGAGATSSRSSTQLTLQKILVTGVQLTRTQDQETTQSDPAEGVTVTPGGELAVTFAVTAEQASQMVYAAEFGSVWLTLQRADTPEVTAGPVTPDNVYARSAGQP